MSNLSIPKPRSIVPRSSADRSGGHFMGAEEFFERLSLELVRHGRYLEGVGLLRIAPERGRLGAEALREAIETETRRTDAICSYPDGSHALILMRAGHEQMATLAQRLSETAREIHGQRGGRPATFVIGAAATENRRLAADELWSMADEALEASQAHANATICA